MVAFALETDTCVLLLFYHRVILVSTEILGLFAEIQVTAYNLYIVSTSTD